MMLSDKNVKRRITAVGLLFIGLLLATEVMAAFLIRDYKKELIGHDYETAGYLVRNGVDTGLVTSAFTADKKEADREGGAAILSASGYDGLTGIRLLPGAWHLYEKYALAGLSIALSFSVILFAGLYLTELHRNRELWLASDQLRKFMDGDTAVRLADCKEDSLSVLFKEINTMATSLTAYVAKEKQNKEFLKDTISDISHQLKTPLAALLMYNEIIRGEQEGSGVVELFAEKSSRELNRMESLIQSLLKLARLDAKAVELKKKPWFLDAFLKECIAFFAVRATEEKKTMNLDCEPAAQMLLDEIWMREAVGNIIKNALDHTEAGGQINISCEETAVAIEITIKDNGSGIYPDDIHHIFKRFYRSRYLKDRQGVGIGLPLSRMIVERHGGTVTVDSEPGCGAQFHLIFPKLTNL